MRTSCCGTSLSWKADGRNACSRCSATGSDAAKARRSISRLKRYGPVRVFTTRIDTIYGATCMILAPEHEIVAMRLNPEMQAAAKRMIDARAQQGPGDVEKEGFDTGLYCVNPVQRCSVYRCGWATLS